MKVFAMADRDGSGTISDSELFHLLKMLYPNISLPECNRIYHQVDANRSGEITFDEFLAGIVQYSWNVSKLNNNNNNNNNNNRNNSHNVRASKQEEYYEWEIPFEELEYGAKLGEGKLLLFLENNQSFFICRNFWCSLQRQMERTACGYQRAEISNY
jgi:hypothetical protein